MVSIWPEMKFSINQSILLLAKFFRLRGPTYKQNTNVVRNIYCTWENQQLNFAPQKSSFRYKYLSSVLCLIWECNYWNICKKSQKNVVWLHHVYLKLAFHHTVGAIWTLNVSLSSSTTSQWVLSLIFHFPLFNCVEILELLYPRAYTLSSRQCASPCLHQISF